MSSVIVEQTEATTEVQPEMKLQVAVSKASLDEQLAEFVADALKRGVDARGFASLIVSGGSTPKGFFQTLSSMALPWEKIAITLADERCVPESDERSNARLVKENLMQNAASAAQFVPLFVEGEALPQTEARFNQIPAFVGAFDVVILGMGGDAHTASIFPEAKERDEALDLGNTHSLLITDPVTVTPLRITQTRPRLLNTENLILHITGASKWKVFEDARAEPAPEKPISQFVEQTEIPLNVFYTAE